jgi:hypothetical protein
MYHHPSIFAEIGILLNFYPSWLPATILLISTSSVAGITNKRLHIQKEYPLSLVKLNLINGCLSQRN